MMDDPNIASTLEIFLTTFKKLHVYIIDYIITLPAHEIVLSYMELLYVHV